MLKGERHFLRRSYPTHAACLVGQKLGIGRIGDGRRHGTLRVRRRYIGASQQSGINDCNRSPYPACHQSLPS